MATDTNLSQLVINKLTKAQYQEAKEAGSIVETEIYMITDDNEVERIVTSVSLLASNWSNLSQTVSVSGVTASNTVFTTSSPANHEAYGESGVYCSSQANGTLTFKCEDVPKVELIVNVLILN